MEVMPLKHELDLTAAAVRLDDMLQVHSEDTESDLLDALEALEAELYALTEDLPKQKIPGEDEAMLVYIQACRVLNRPQLFHLDPQTKRIERGAVSDENEAESD